MFKILDTAAIYLSKWRSTSGNNSTTAETPTESITLDISKKFLEMLKSSFKLLTFSFTEAGKFSKKDNKFFTTSEHKILKVHKEIESKIADIVIDDIIAFAITLFNFGAVYIKIIEMESGYQEEEKILILYDKAESFFKICLQLLKEKKLLRDSKAILTVMRAYDELSRISTKYETLEEHHGILLEALNIYVEYTKDGYPNPVDVAKIFILGADNVKELDTKVSLDNLHIKLLEKLSKIYIYNPDNKHEFVNYMHDLLNNLIKEESIHDYYMDWAMAVAELSRYFIRHNRFTEAKTYLTVASYIMEKYNAKQLVTTLTEITISDNQNTDSNLLLYTAHEEYRYKCAKIAKLWGQYGIQLLYVSKEKLLQNEENQSCELDNLECSNSTKSKEEYLIFTNLKEELTDKSQIYNEYSLHLNDIKIVFEKVLKYFNTAKEYFTMKKDMQTYGEIILYISIAYKYFANFERYKAKRMKIYEQQIELLNNTIEELKSESTAINNIKKLMCLELGISHSAILDILSDGIIISDVKSDREILLKMKNCMCDGMNSFVSYLQLN